MARTTTCTIALVLGLVATTASAEVRNSESEATRIFERGESAYGEGQFAEAAELMRRAYELQPEPILLFNIGRALEGDGNVSGAIEAYSRYLEVSPDAENRGLVERRLAVLNAQQRDLETMQQELHDAEARLQEAEVGSGDSSNGRDVSARRSVNPIPWAIMGVGLASVIAGGVLGALALDREETGNADPVQLSAFNTLEEGRRFALAANITLVAGGAVAIAGLVWGLVDLIAAPRRRRSTERAITVRIAPFSLVLSR